MVTFQSSITGMILAGGRGTRMGRVDKGLQPFAGGTLAGQVLHRLAPQVASVAINANRNPAVYAALGAPVWPDELAGYQGPLAGLHAGLRRCATALLLTVPCDSPFLPADLSRRLHDALREQDADVAVAVTEESDEDGASFRQRHPVFSLVKTSALPALDAYLAGGGRRMDGWYDAVKVAEVPFTDTAAFANINTASELRDLEKLATRPSLRDAGGNPDAMPVEQAQRIIQNYVQPVRTVEKVALRAALDRVLAADVVSPINVPAHDNSAMDGYAFRGAELEADGPTTFRITAVVLAGRPCNVAVGAGECVRIMTGGMMPDGLDTVLPQELAAAITVDSVTVAAGSIAPGANRRFKGEDLAEGSPALRKGKLVRPADLGLIASLGIAEVAVQRKLRVAFFSTGDELRSIGEPLQPGCIYDSNRYTLYGMLQRLGCEVVDMGTVPDDRRALEAAVRSACDSADAVLTTGGVSSGDVDYVRAIMGELGDVAFWKLNMRPGRPMAFGRVESDGRGAYLFGLPGNPVAAMVNFYFFVRPALLKMMGAEHALPLLRARSVQAIGKKRGRAEFQRGILGVGADGAPEVRITGAQGSGILRSMSEANCLVILPADSPGAAAGDQVDLLPFDGLI